VVLNWIDQEPAPVNPDGAILSSNSSILKIIRYTPFRKFDVKPVEAPTLETIGHIFPSVTTYRCKMKHIVNSLSSEIIDQATYLPAQQHVRASKIES